MFRYPSLAVAAGVTLLLGSTAGVAAPKNAPYGSATVGSGGSAAAGGTSASTLGLGAESNTPSGSAASLGTGGSAAAAGGRAMSHGGVHGGGGNLNGNAMAMGNEGHGVWSKSHTITHVHGNGDLSSRTKSMSHEPGGPPSMSTSGANQQIPQQ